jgi:hypothetical protein
LRDGLPRMVEDFRGRIFGDRKEKSESAVWRPLFFVPAWLGPSLVIQTRYSLVGGFRMCKVFFLQKSLALLGCSMQAQL